MAGFSFLKKQNDSEYEIEEEKEKEELFDYRKTEEYKTFINVLEKRFEIYKRQLDRDTTKKIESVTSELKNKIEFLKFSPEKFNNDLFIDFDAHNHKIYGSISLPLMNIKFQKDIIYDLYDEELEEDELEEKLKERWENVFKFIEEIATPIEEEIFRDKEYNFSIIKKEKITGTKKHRLWIMKVKFSFIIPVPEDYDENKIVKEDKGNESYDYSLEEKKVVMNKTIYTSSDKSDETVKVDHLDKNQDLEKDAVKVMKSERDVTATYPLPLFRFEEKQEPQLIEIAEKMIEIAEEMMKEEPTNYSALLNYIKIPEKKDIKFIFDLIINRNSELFTSSPKEMEAEIITCFYDKKLRVSEKIPEDELINKEDHPEYFNKISEIRKTFKEFLSDLLEKMDLKNNKFMKDVEFYTSDSSGSENEGAGISIFIKYNKPIDYSNKKRGKEDYGPYLCALDEEFVQSMEEQNSIILSKSTEAIADGMGEGNESEESNDSEDENPEDSSESDDSEDMEDGDDESGDDFGGDDEGFGDEGDGESEGDEDSSSDSEQNSDSNSEPKISGTNPFADINARDKITNELQELKSEIDKALVKLEPFKQSVLVGKLRELVGFVEDALKNAYIVNIEDSLIRYNLYVTQYEDLIKALKRSFEKASAKKDIKKTDE